MTKIGIGYGNDQDAYGLGRCVAQSALQSGVIEAADMLIAFCNGHLDIDRYYLGLRSVVGEATPIIGGSAVGVITWDYLSYEGYPAAAMAIESDSIRNCAGFSASITTRRCVTRTAGSTLSILRIGTIWHEPPALPLNA